MKHIIFGCFVAIVTLSLTDSFGISLRNANPNRLSLPVASLIPLQAKKSATHALSITSSSSSTSSSPPSPNRNKKKKNNKYANFSKTENMEVDPLDALIAASEQKNQELEQQAAQQRNQKVPSPPLTNERRDRNKRQFPNTQTIDPYDPTTYGYTELGTILGAHGVRGLLKIAAVTEFPERLCNPGIRHLKSPNRRSPREIRLVEGRLRLKREYLIKLEGIGDRNEANKLRGSVLYARQEERPGELKEDEYLVTELVGLEVRLVTGYGESDDNVQVETNGEESNSAKFVGTVGGIVLADEMCSIPGLGQDFLEVVLPRGRYGTPSWKDEMVLIPIVPAIVPTVDLEFGIIYIDPPGGLLDLMYVNQDTVRIKGFLPEKSSYEDVN